MASTYTTNKSIEKPAAGDYVNAWAPPVNADWDDIDTALGGSTSIIVTGIGPGPIALTLTQYRPPNIQFSGVLSQALTYQVPTGIGGIWSVYNNTTGAFNLTFGVAAGGSFVVPQGQRALLICDGVNMVLAQNAVTAFSQLTGQIAPAQVPVGAVTQFDSSLSIAFTQLTGSATVAQLPANAYRGTLGSAQVTVQSGGSPSGGSAGDLVLIY